MLATSPGHVAFLAVAIATHALVGYALGELAAGRPWVGTIGGVLADADFLFPAVLDWPFVHRGITHTLGTAAVASLLVGRYDRRWGAAFAAAYGSHLLIDATTPTGVPLLAPLASGHVSLALPTTGHSPVPTVGLCVASLLVVYRRRASPRE